MPKYVPIEIRLANGYKEENRGFQTDCWIWQKALLKGRGYGLINVRGKSTLAHRVSYEIYVADIPLNAVIDHLCKQFACINPKHLEAVTQQVNVLRGNGTTPQKREMTYFV